MSRPWPIRKWWRNFVGWRSSKRVELSACLVRTRRRLREKRPRYYLTRQNGASSGGGSLVRDQRTIENSLHWVMDMLRHDECRI